MSTNVVAALERPKNFLFLVLRKSDAGGGNPIYLGGLSIGTTPVQRSIRKSYWEAPKLEPCYDIGPGHGYPSPYG